MAEVERSLLLVEDDAQTTELFSNMLSLSRITAPKTDNIRKAVVCINSEAPSKVILGPALTDDSGSDVLGRIRRQPARLQAPVMAVSDKGRQSDVQERLQAGTTENLTLPVSFTDVKRAVTDVVHGSKQVESVL